MLKDLVLIFNDYKIWTLRSKINPEIHIDKLFVLIWLCLASKLFLKEPLRRLCVKLSMTINVVKFESIEVHMTCYLNIDKRFRTKVSFLQEKKYFWEDRNPLNIEILMVRKSRRNLNSTLCFQLTVWNSLVEVLWAPRKIKTFK